MEGKRGEAPSRTAEPGDSANLPSSEVTRHPLGDPTFRPIGPETGHHRCHRGKLLRG